MKVYSKTIATITILLCLVASVNVQAQDCDPYIPIENGTEIERTNYTSKGKADSKVVQTITDKKTTSTGLSATLKSQIYDKKDKEVSSSTCEIKCVGGSFMVELSGVIPSDSWDQYENMNIEMDGEYMDIPSSPTVGDKLDDKKLTLNVSNSGVSIVSMSVLISNRKIESKESVTTSAGTFDCIVMTYDVETTIGGVFPIKVKSSSKDWYSKGTGLVKQESYNKNGKMDGYSLITKLTKP